MQPAQIAKLTRWQVVHLYLQPQEEAMKALKGEPDGGGVTAETTEEELPSKEFFVAFWSTQFPDEPLSKWESDYDRLLAEQE